MKFIDSDGAVITITDDGELHKYIPTGPTVVQFEYTLDSGSVVKRYGYSLPDNFIIETKSLGDMTINGKLGFYCYDYVDEAPVDLDSHPDNEFADAGMIDMMIDDLRETHSFYKLLTYRFKKPKSIKKSFVKKDDGKNGYAGYVKVQYQVDYSAKVSL